MKSRSWFCVLWGTDVFDVEEIPHESFSRSRTSLAIDEAQCTTPGRYKLGSFEDATWIAIPALSCLKFVVSSKAACPGLLVCRLVGYASITPSIFSRQAVITGSLSSSVNEAQQQVAMASVSVSSKSRLASLFIED